MSSTDNSVELKISPVFKDFLEFLTLKYKSESVQNLLEGVFQRAFFDDWIEYLGYRKKLDTDTSVIKHIKKELFNDKF